MLKNQPFFLEAQSNTQQACLLLHGLGGGVYEMQLLAQSLHELGISVQGINYPGHDQPTARMPDSTWKDWYGWILENYQQLTQRYASVTVIGFSTGCPLALNLALALPVDKLVLLSPYLAIRHQWYYILRPEAYLFSIGRLLTNLPRRHLPIRDQGMRELAHQAIFFKTFNLNAVRSANELIASVKTQLHRIMAPTLIIQPRLDTIVDPSGAEFIYQNLGSQTKKLVWLDESDHIIPLDVEREIVFKAVGEFVLHQPN